MQKEETEAQDSKNAQFPRDNFQGAVGSPWLGAMFLQSASPCVRPAEGPPRIRPRPTQGLAPSAFCPDIADH